MNQTVYLDHNATTPVRPEAAEAAAGALSLVGNASSTHRFGRTTRHALDDARERVAAMTGALPDLVVFTSGGTEANRLALTGDPRRRRVLASAVEHPSVLKARDDIEILPVDTDGILDLNALEAALARSSDPAIVSVMLANNETGVIQPVAEAAEIVRRHGALLHCDAVQAIGKVPVDLRALGAHMISVSAHKMGGPPGVGALALALDVPLEAVQRGGGQERGLRAGTENVPGIVGFGMAAKIVAEEDREQMSASAALRDRLEARVREAAPDVRIMGAGVDRLPNTTCMVVPGIKGNTQLMALDLAGVAVSAGAACSSGKTGGSHVLRAMGLDDEDAASAIRVSFGWNSRDEDVDRFVDTWMELTVRLASGRSPNASAA